MFRRLLAVLIPLSLFACSSSDPEKDPVYEGSPTSAITSEEISRWNQAYGWGDHAAAGYLTTESDPLFSASSAASISASDLASWNQAAAWGDHAAAGYLKTEGDPVFSASSAAAISATDVANWNQAFAWGNHASVGYLTTEADPKIGTLTPNAVPRWTGGQLRTGSITDTGTGVGISTTSPSGVLDVRAPSAEMTKDQAQEQVNLSAAGPGIHQQFTAGKAGILSAVDLYWVSGANDFQVHVLNVEDGSVLASTECQAFSYGWVTCRFPAPLTVTAGTTYDLFLNASSSVFFACANADVYPGGGSNIAGGDDLTFRTWVGSAQPAPALEVGAGAVSVKTLFHLAPRASPPPTAEPGDVYYDAAQNKLCYYNGTAWICL
jgi:hypothetical protein